jgi:hypothetical protein
VTTWSITITDNQGGTHTPHIYAPPGEAHPREIPAVNGVPTLEFGVLPRDSGSWFDAKFENADISVSKDGTSQPYSRLIGPTDDSGQGIVTLRADGGEELNKRVDETFGVLPTHEAATQLVNSYTSYSTDIPTPSTTRTDNVTIKTISSGGFTSADIRKIPEDSPATINGSGYLTATQSLWRTTSTGQLSDPGDEFTFNFTTSHWIPKERVGAALNTDVDSDHIGVEMSVNGTVIHTIRPGESFDPSPAWSYSVGADDELSPGDHKLTVSVTETEDAAGNPTSGLTPDMVCVFDDAHHFPGTFDGDLNATPDLYASHIVPIVPPLVTRSVRGLTVSPTWTGGNTGGFLLRNDPSETYTGGTDLDFSDHGAVADVAVVITDYNAGDSVTELQALTIDADLETMPLTVNDRIEGTVSEGLTFLSDSLRGDFAWTLDADAGNSPPETVRFVQTGSRSETQNDLEAYNIRKSTEKLLDEVKVIAGAVSTSEQIRADHDTAVDLTRDRLVEDSETVRTPNRDQPAEKDTHYAIDYANGTITVDSNPANATAIPDEELITVEYKFEPSATATVSSPSTPKQTRVVSELPLRSDRACQLAAKQILDAASTPDYWATARLPADTTYSVVESLSSSRFPPASLKTTDITATPTGSQVRLESQQSDSDVVSDVRSFITKVSQYTR